jgi:hypothetical protein
MTPACWVCEEPCEDLGLADVSMSNDSVQLWRSFRCLLCGEEYLQRPKPPSGWREEIRAAVGEVRAIRAAGGVLPVRGQP